MLNNRVDRVFHALGDPTRRAIVDRLSRGPSSVSEIAAPLGITLAAVVQHVQVLEDAGLLRSKKVGRVRACQIHGDGFRVLERWIADRRAGWERRFDRLGEIVEKDRT